MVSIKDIAKKAGVSISTVSYALNGSPKVTTETCAKILAIAKELNYVPNAAARTLKTRETKIIGVYLTDFSGAFYGDLLQGVNEMLHRKGYDTIVCSGKRSHRMLPERMIDGAIVLDAMFDSDELLRYAELGHKVVVLDRELNHPNINQVLLDNKAGATLAMEHLLDRGFRKIYAIMGPEESYDAGQRLQAVKQAVERCDDLTFKAIEGSFRKESGEEAAKKILAEYTEPAAVFCMNDEMAIGVHNYVSQTDYVVGEHIHIIGFDNVELASYMQPKLATIDYSKHKWGALASEQLLKIIAGEPVENERIYVTLVEGDSVGINKEASAQR
ncbi:transcriptional regulator, LacI family [Paenibacillus algorifonticola]|uniref:Transcriptional regulator, LacI family n=1 Tax=Paenibacillus algorifonticola TaxID=684063 RepID=A0A1I2H898_9BACL|nr:LacI family DNA-binding transcriptional regulator [Paenibacillus algorifonticola]SFF24976.1 transcriptional regulator, LacI family [Paenibacillus algorifonticola]